MPLIVSGAGGLPEYCVSTIVSIALRAARFDGRLHGHDVGVKACVKTSTVVDITVLKRLLEEAASSYDHVFLDEVIGGEPLIEDLISALLNGLLDRLNDAGIRFSGAWIKAIIPDGEIILSKEEADQWRV